ncbi:MAG TPA: LCP family protein [Candidatus Limnocylindrales bacterium]|nr:LCP family protein [Candidatus Limnocylindrales bacterium]
MQVTRAPRWPTVLLALGLMFMMVSAAGLVAVKSLLHRYESSMDHEILLAPEARDASPSHVGAWRHDGEPLNFLLIGSDLRASNPDAGQRSDTIIVVQINRQRNGAHLVSIPRDLLVDIPEFAPTEFYGGREKINAAFQFGGGSTGGVQLLSATLAQLTGVKFDGAAVIDFRGLERVIDMLGGVRVCVDTEVTSIHTRHIFPLGCQVFSGAEALDYSRQRYGLENGDYDRQRHNQQLIKAIFGTALSQGIAYNPVKLDQFIRILGDSLTVDTGGASVSDVVLALRSLRPDALVGVTVPSYPEMIGDESFVVMNEETPALFYALRSGALNEWAAVNPQWVHPL